MIDAHHANKASIVQNTHIHIARTAQQGKLIVIGVFDPINLIRHKG